MDQIEELVSEVKKRIELTELTLEKFEESKNPKLLFAGVQNLYIAINKSATISLLMIDKSIDLESLKVQTLDKKLNQLRKLKKISEEDTQFIFEMKEIILKHKKSKMVFPRKGGLIICENDYDMITLSKTKIKNYYQKAKVFINKLFSYKD